MATLTIRNLDPAVKERLRLRAAERGHSMEAEARRILQTALGKSSHLPTRNLYERIHSRFAVLGGVDLDLPPRERSANRRSSISLGVYPRHQRLVCNHARSAGAELLFTTALSQAEILSGLAIMPEGRRRRDLEAAARAMFVEDFDGRVLPFDSRAAAAYADLFAARRQSGRPMATLDLLIASVARSHDASVVTRDSSGFENCSVALINPWEAV